jgi:hypothetical protein
MYSMTQLLFYLFLPLVAAFSPFAPVGARWTSGLNLVKGPSLESKPDYENIHGPLGKTSDNLFLQIFRSNMAKAIGFDSKLPLDDYKALIELTAHLNSFYSDKVQIQQISREILRTCPELASTH